MTNIISKHARTCPTRAAVPRIMVVETADGVSISVSRWIACQLSTEVEKRSWCWHEPTPARDTRILFWRDPTDDDFAARSCSSGTSAWRVTLLDHGANWRKPYGYGSVLLGPLERAELTLKTPAPARGDPATKWKRMPKGTWLLTGNKPTTAEAHSPESQLTCFAFCLSVPATALCFIAVIFYRHRIFAPAAPVGPAEPLVP